MEKVIVVEDLQKIYNPKRSAKPLDVKALYGISFKIERGEFFGLLGPNGAGKTTTNWSTRDSRFAPRGCAPVEGVD